MLEHKHLILHGMLLNPPQHAEQIEVALTEIVLRVNMRILAPARARYCAEIDNEGFTGDVLLTTSHMIWHDWNIDPVGERTSAFLRFDLYSCSDFDIKTVIHFLSDSFGLTQYEYKLFDRNSSIIMIGEGNSIDG